MNWLEYPDYCDQPAAEAGACSAALDAAQSGRHVRALKAVDAAKRAALADAYRLFCLMALHPPFEDSVRRQLDVGLPHRRQRSRVEVALDVVADPLRIYDEPFAYVYKPILLDALARQLDPDDFLEAASFDVAACVEALAPELTG